MCWKVFQLVFLAKSPLHIGAQRVGMIQRTRHYIPAMTFWGALTSGLTRRLYPQPRPEDYQTVGQFCHNHLLTSYFFPTLGYSKGQGLNKLLMPGYHPVKGEWFYGLQEEMPQAEFERIFLMGYGSTAIDYQFTAARDASLHEIQLLLHQVKFDNQIKQVYFGGYLFAKEKKCGPLELSVEASSIILTHTGEERSVDLFEAIAFPQIGGERAYGYGQLKLFDKQSHREKQLWGGICEIETGNERLHLKIEAENENSIGSQKERGIPFPAHLLVDGIDTANYQIRGELEALVSRRWRKKGAGENPEHLGACFVPGSTPQKTLTVSIQDYGILKVVPER